MGKKKRKDLCYQRGTRNKGEEHEKIKNCKEKSVPAALKPSALVGGPRKWPKLSWEWGREKKKSRNDLLFFHRKWF